MLIAPKKGFVFLAFTKAASTSIESAFGPHVDGGFYANPFKHTRYDQFQRHIQPFLKAKGFERSSYEVLCVSREPIDWLFSWWRYRSRDQLASRRRSHKRSHYAGHVTFEEFVQAYMRHHRGEGRPEESYAHLGRPSRFVQSLPGKPDLDRIYRYDRLDLLVKFLSKKIGQKVSLGAENASPPREFSLSDECYKELREFMEPDYAVYENAIGS